MTQCLENMQSVDWSINEPTLRREGDLRTALSTELVDWVDYP
jgi:hypothetical protein